MTVKAEDFVRMPLAELTTPRDGAQVYKDRWWAMTEQGEALFYKSYSHPQCNSARSIAERLAPMKNHIEFVPLAFVPIIWADYRD